MASSMSHPLNLPHFLFASRRQIRHFSRYYEVENYCANHLLAFWNMISLFLISLAVQTRIVSYKLYDIIFYISFLINLEQLLD